MKQLSSSVVISSRRPCSRRDRAGSPAPPILLRRRLLYAGQVNVGSPVPTQASTQVNVGNVRRFVLWLVQDPERRQRADADWPALRGAQLGDRAQGNGLIKVL